MELLKTNISKIDWNNLSMNVNPEAIEMLKKNINKVDWSELSKNPNAIELLKENIDKVDWYRLSWNPNAIEILKANQNKIYWHCLSRNPNIIQLDYQQMTKNFEPFYQEIIAKVLHPDRILRYKELYNYNIRDWFY